MSNKVLSRLEEFFLIFGLSAMTLVTFIYVLLNKLYEPFLWLGSKISFFEDVGIFILEAASSMTYTLALTKLLCAVLVFLGASYGVRTAGHIGIDILTKRFPLNVQRSIATVAVVLCIVYCGIVVYAAWEWVNALYTADVEAEDLEMFGIKLWHIGLILLLGYALLIYRFVEILIRILQGKQHSIGLADETEDALKLQAEGEI
ncbi:probable dicarboxylate transporter [Taylorella asinigenitalis 14/45]|uniref:TRAP transporter small permease protein n=2 Tax=Taylorella asinigenitalis TaxID=84590 RepID=G4QDD8_TAYAM|nr:TRAP transporter small permease [Taylorella asinigenitalis]AEP35955.1 putative dicarboxylate transporter [Taylorella asinigenitalis MCE3]CCG19527.1 probable dicarboxylate transporter [Taylorella asinigenitalis 14/45]